MIQIRPVHSDSLRGACKEVAINNHGFLYPDNRDLRSKVQDEYKKRGEVQGSLLYSSTVSGDQIRSEMEDFDAGDDRIQHLGDTGGYFFDLEQFPAWSDDKAILDVFASTLDTDAPVAREKGMKSDIQANGIIADNDVPHLLNYFSANERDDSTYLEALEAEGTTFYLPGRKLLEENNTRPLSALEGELAGAAEENGTVTRRDIENALGVEAPDRLVYKLTRRDYLIKLDGSEQWLVNEEGCIERFTQSAVEADVVPKLREVFRDRNFAIPVEEFGRTVREELEASTGITRQIDDANREEVLDGVETNVLRSLADGEDDIVKGDITDRIDDPSIDDMTTVEYYFWEPKMEANVRSEADRLDDEYGFSEPSGTDLRHTDLTDEMPAFEDEWVSKLYAQLIEAELKRSI